VIGTVTRGDTVRTFAEIAADVRRHASIHGGPDSVYGGPDRWHVEVHDGVAKLISNSSPQNLVIRR
jgi:hypothetical protein